METDREVLDQEAERFIKDAAIPSCPAILTQLTQEMASDDPDLDKVSKLIGGDVSLAAALLKTVNSPFYGLRSKATSVTQAIALLGLRKFTHLITRQLLRQAFPAGKSGLMDKFWEILPGIARINTLLARELKHVNDDAAHTFALFRDCGMLAMLQGLKGYAPVLPGAEAGGEAGITAMEDERYGMNHARIGYHLTKTWLLPDEICLAVLRHHDYAELQASGAGVPPAGLQHIALTLAAESIYVTHEMGVASAEWARGGTFALAALEIAQDDLDGMADAVNAESADG